jgi:hypothetical protein
MKSPPVVRQLMKSFIDASTAKQAAKTTSRFLCLDTTNHPHLTAWPNLFRHLSVHEATSIIMQIKKFDYYTENFGDTEFWVAKQKWVVVLNDFLQVKFPFGWT